MKYFITPLTTSIRLFRTICTNMDKSRFDSGKHSGPYAPTHK